MAKYIIVGILELEETRLLYMMKKVIAWQEFLCPYNTIYPAQWWHEQKPSDWWKAIVL
jgi:sugar (pentulose or hexulose) kinase